MRALIRPHAVLTLWLIKNSTTRESYWQARDRAMNVLYCAATRACDAGLDTETVLHQLSWYELVDIVSL